MNHLLRNKLQTSQFGSRNYNQAHSPLHRAILDTAEKRSQLFPDKRRIPGRKVKAIAVVWLLSQAWGMKKLVEIKRMQDRRAKQSIKIQRRAIPFLQAITDLHYLEAEERKNLIVKELFAHKSKEFHQRVTKRYNQTEFWQPFYNRGKYQYLETARNLLPYSAVHAGRVNMNYDMGNI